MNECRRIYWQKKKFNMIFNASSKASSCEGISSFTFHAVPLHLFFVGLLLLKLPQVMYVYVLWECLVSDTCLSPPCSCSKKENKCCAVPAHFILSGQRSHREQDPPIWAMAEQGMLPIPVLPVIVYTTKQVKRWHCLKKKKRHIELTPQKEGSVASVVT